MIAEHLFDAVIAILLALVFGAIGTALSRIWAAQNRLMKQSERHGNRLTRLETKLNTYQNGDEI